jgi:hypothetical protein
VRVRRGVSLQIGEDVVGQRTVAVADQVVVGIGDPIHRRTRADDETSRVGRAPVLQEMADRFARAESCGVARPQHGLRVALAQGHLARQHIDHLVLGAMPVLNRGARTGRHDLDKRSELAEAAGFADPEQLVRTA